MTARAPAASATQGRPILPPPGWLRASKGSTIGDDRCGGQHAGGQPSTPVGDADHQRTARHDHADRRRLVQERSTRRGCALDPRLLRNVATGSPRRRPRQAPGPQSRWPRIARDPRTRRSPSTVAAAGCRARRAGPPGSRRRSPSAPAPPRCRPARVGWRLSTNPAATAETAIRSCRARSRRIAITAARTTNPRASPDALTNGTASAAGAATAHSGYSTVKEVAHGERRRERGRRGPANRCCRSA